MVYTRHDMVTHITLPCLYNTWIKEWISQSSKETIGNVHRTGETCMIAEEC